jgi:quinoprotein glucose dehydrogenase
VPAPEYRVIPAATPEELTPAIPAPPNEHPGDWRRAHADDASSGYSELRQITRENVARLKPAWTWHSNDGAAGIEANPVAVDGTVYTPTSGGNFVALNGATGKEIWRFKPEGAPAIRGLLYWPGDANHAPRLYFSSGNWLYALDPATGKPVASFGDAGRVPARSTVAPSVYRDTLIIPCWNVVRAFDVLDGKPLWTFHLAAWSDTAWGANSWGGMALDPARGIAYVSTGSPHPNFIGANHPGDDNYANSVVALDAATGALKWSFQEVHHDIWDWDIPSPPNLVTVTREGRKYDAVAQITKIGNTLLLDRVSGKPLFPIRMRRAPASTVEGEQTAEWQPDIELPEPFSRQVFSPEQITTLSPAAHAFVAKKTAGARFGWFLPVAENTPTIWYSSLGGGEWTGASFDPENEWLFLNANDFPVWSKLQRAPLPPDASKDPSPGAKAYTKYCAACHGADRNGVTAPSLLYILGRENMTNIARIVREGRRSMPPVAAPQADVKPLMDFLAKPVSSKTTVLEDVWLGRVVDQQGHPGVKPPWGTLNAINLRTGHIEWKVPLGEYEDLAKAGVPTTGTENFGATILTATGVIFCAGTPDQKIRAFDSRTGKLLWQYKMPFAAYAQPATYETGGKQYVVIAAGGGGQPATPEGDVYMAFALP